jgi:hypothetical protein
VLLWPFFPEASASYPSTGTSRSLASGDAHHWSFVLLVEGYPLAFCTSDEVSALSTAWSAVSEWPAVYGGLHMIGEVTHSAYPFDSSVDMPGMTFEITDAGDVLLPVAFKGEPAIKERLDNAATDGMDADDTTLVMGDSSAFPASGTLYVGTEEMTYTFNGGSGTISGITRGVRSLFGTAYGNNFGRPHEVDFEGDYSPVVSTEPRGLLGKNVGLYLCRKVDGTWTAGLPGSSSNDSECVWAGTIREILDDGTGKISLRCSSILELLKGSLLNQQYKGYLPDGEYLLTSEGYFQVIVNRVDVITGTQDTWDQTITDLIPSAALYTHEQVADLIRAQLSEWFVTSGLFPSGQILSLQLANSADGAVRYVFTLEDDAAGTLSWSMEIRLSKRIWEILGFTNLEGNIQTYRYYSKSRGLGEQPIWIRAENPPARARAGAIGGIINVRDALNSPFVAQPAAGIPPDLLGNPAAPTEGFLRIGGKVIFGVRETSANQFTITKNLGSRYAELTGTVLPDDLEGEELPRGTIDGSSGDGVVVEQVWLEVGKVSEVFKRLMLSTGTNGYNDLTYDVNPRQMGLGIPYKLIDMDSLSHLSGTSPYVLYLDRATPFLRLFESVMACGGGG